MSGWIKLHRKLIDSKFGKNVEMIGLFPYLLLMANHKEGFTADGTKINAGQFMTSQKELANHFKMDRSKMRRMLEKLSNAGQIEQQTTEKNTIITIINWEMYQQDEHQANIKRTSNEHQTNTNKNNNNNKNNNILELAEERQGKTHEKLAAKGHILNPEYLVIEHYNQANKRTLKQVDSNYKEIKARLKEGYTVDEMRVLIDYAAKVWAADPFWSGKNRPSTLFNGKFDGYLQEAQDALKPEIDPAVALFKKAFGDDWQGLPSDEASQA